MLRPIFALRWWDAGCVTVLGQGCLEPITIARADTQQCERFTMDYALSLLFDNVPPLSLSFSLWVFRFALSFTWDQVGTLSNSYQRRGTLGDLDAFAPHPPSMKIAGGPGSPLLVTVLPFPVNKTRLPRITRFLAGGDTRRFRSLNTPTSPPRWPVFETRAKPACLRVIECAHVYIPACYELGWNYVTTTVDQVLAEISSPSSRHNSSVL